MYNIGKWLIVSFLFVILLVACSEPEPTPEETFNAFAAHWQEGNYDEMYELVSKGVQDTVSKEYFIKTYTDIYETIEANHVSVDLITLNEGEEEEEEIGTEVILPYEKSLEIFTGDMAFESTVLLELEENEEEGQQWKIKWSPAMIFPMLEIGDEVKAQI